ncbi:hypothetical protein C174_19446 [Bacillus mycoides FSL H7-687]|nr:hypothetical protein C174_19446 [Bacillus mycoides FSL H7-687]
MQMLLELETDDDVGFCWWDAGVLHFFIRKDDLTVPIVLFIPIKLNNRNTYTCPWKLLNGWAYLRRVTRGHFIIL